MCDLVLCGAPLTRRAACLTSALLDAGWRVRLAATVAAAEWIDEAALRDLAGHAPRTSYRRPEPAGHPEPAGNLEPAGHPEPAGSPPAEPDAIAVVPMTFNTLNKLATGIADSYAHTKLCLALGQGTPIVAVPMFSTNLGRHPAAANSIAVLRRAGVVFVDPCTGGPDVVPFPPGSDDEVVRGFDPSWVVDRLRQRVVVDAGGR